MPYKTKEARREHYNKNKLRMNNQAREYYKKHREIYLKEKKDYYKKNKNKLLKKNKKYYNENWEELNVKHKQYQFKNRKILRFKHKISSKKQYNKNKEIINKKKKEWRQNNKEKEIAKSVLSRMNFKSAKFCIKVTNSCMKLASEKHHDDYSKPEEFVSVCKSCHSQLNLQRKAREDKK